MFDNISEALPATCAAVCFSCTLYNIIFLRTDCVARAILIYCSQNDDDDISQAGAKPTTDFGACRDLQGRRLRHVNDEVRLQKWQEDRCVRSGANSLLNIATVVLYLYNAAPPVCVRALIEIREARRPPLGRPETWCLAWSAVYNAIVMIPVSQRGP